MGQGRFEIGLRVSTPAEVMSIFLPGEQKGSSMEFDFERVFDPDDYLYFYGLRLTPERNDQDAERVWRLLDLAPGMTVLDLACGHGRIANRLAERGCMVTGLDATEGFLELARADAEDRGVEVEYVLGDMRAIPWTGRFDRVVNWFTSFGYFEDEDNRKVVSSIRQALKPSGRAVVEVQHRDVVVGDFPDDRVEERDGNYMVDRTSFEPLMGRTNTERILIRDGRIRRFGFFVRLFGHTELRQWMLDSGFSSTEAFGEDGEPLSATSRRLAVVATA
jgi:SAM-dependent methyltransferase